MKDAFIAHRFKGVVHIKRSNYLVNFSSLMNEELSNAIIMIIAANLIYGGDHASDMVNSR